MKSRWNRHSNMRLFDIFRRASRPVTCQEAGRGGYVVRRDRERAAVNAKCREMCARMGKPVPEVLQ